jgi:hypothetical protein
MVKKTVDSVTRKLAEMDFYRRFSSGVVTIVRPARKAERAETPREHQGPSPNRGKANSCRTGWP